MTNTERQTTGFIECIHCGNRAPMNILAKYYASTIPNDDDEFSHYRYREEGYHYQLLLCLACKEVTFWRYFESEYVDDDMPFEILYPSTLSRLSGLPSRIQRAYEIALKVRPIDVNAYGVLLGRILEMICEDRKATGKDLNEKISNLATKNEIPGNLANVAHGLRRLRNIGAHASLGELTPQEIPILDNLCRAILEYVYVAPSLAAQAEQRFNSLKRKKPDKEETEN